METSRHGSAKSRRKQLGAHYTPARLADFVATRAVAALDRGLTERVRVLDPACGDGQLLEAGIEALRGRGFANWQACGVESDAQALEAARARLTHEGTALQLVFGDFLSVAAHFGSAPGLWREPPAAHGLTERFDLVIANPPYVRTQVLGAAEAQRLARRYDLSGRVDLYFAFVRAIGDVLRTGGVLGIITSNRFMATLAGKAVRAYLSSEFELLEVVDFGDSKLFDAAVLPAVLIARRRNAVQPVRPYLVPFTSVYSCSRPDLPLDRVACSRASVIDAVEAADEGLVEVQNDAFEITRGRFTIAAGDAHVWTLMPPAELEFLRRVHEHCEQTIEDAAFVRVGIKSTADDVFIRDDWASLPSHQQPEDDLLRSILRHDDAQRWALPREYVSATRVLYPHIVAGARKQVADLSKYPRGRAYLESHRARLEGRRYVIEAGRKWYEIWVPQDPGAWSSPKVVFPDISAEPRFFLVDRDDVVNGDCYWITLRPGIADDLLYLVLGVANSSLMTRYHEAAFRNKLYSGRRRYITQYVGKYPLPSCAASASAKVVSLTKALVEHRKHSVASDSARSLEVALDRAVYEAFGFEPRQAHDGQFLVSAELFSD